MDMKRIAPLALALPLIASVVACGERGGGTQAERTAQTHFPGMVTAGGGTSGEVMNQTKRPTTDGSNMGGTPGIPGGAGGTTAGPATAGTVQESGRGPAGAVPPPSGQSTTKQ